MVNVLIIGKTGMLGGMLTYYFSQKEGYRVFTTSRNGSGDHTLAFDAMTDSDEKLQSFIEEHKIDYILNAIGIIKPHCKPGDMEGARKAIEVNALFPHRLAALASATKTKVIQIATDCVYDGRKGAYNESDEHNALDVYGKTKSLGEVTDGRILNIRCSIIGPELKTKLSLLEWVIGHKKGSSLTGYEHHKWNGVTTLRFAQLVDQIISENTYDVLLKKAAVHHYAPAQVWNKSDMLQLFSDIFERDYTIESVSDAGEPIDRSLSTELDMLDASIDFAEDVKELKNMMDNFYSFFD